MILYHGSSIDIRDKLKPHKAFERDDYDISVYFTDEKEIAILYSINPIRAYIKKHYGKNLMVSATSAHKMKMNGVWEVFELYPDMFKDIFSQQSYIYSVEIENDFMQKGEHEYVIPKEIKYKEKIVIDNLYNELIKLQEKGIVKLFSFSDLITQKYYLEYEHIENSLKYRAQFCKSQEERDFFTMLMRYYCDINLFINK